MSEAIESMVEMLKMENVFRPVTLVFIVTLFVIIAKIVITNLIEEYSEAKTNEIYSKF